MTSNRKKPRPTLAEFEACWLDMTGAELKTKFGLRSVELTEYIKMAGGAVARNQKLRDIAKAKRFVEWREVGATLTRFEAAERFKVSLSTIDTWMKETGIRCMQIDRYHRNEPEKTPTMFSFEWIGKSFDKALWQKVMGPW